jgi:hypothetical protein
MLTDNKILEIRSRFRIFQRKIYLNSCSQGALSDAVQTGLEDYIASWHEQGSPWETWVDHYEAARVAFARFINASPDEVAIVTSASAGINSVASAIVAGDAFKPNVLAGVESLTERNRKLRSAMLGKAMIIRLRQAEDAQRSGNSDLVDQRLKSLSEIVDETFRNAPDDPFLWLTEFWLDATRNGMRPNPRFLRMSYELGPYEGWVDIRRDGLALAVFSALPGDLAERAISEFVELVRWRLAREAAAIAAGPGLPLRSVLFPRLKDLGYEQRRAFADAVYGRELDDVPIPGIDPPIPQVRVPVMPPDL